MFATYKTWTAMELPTKYDLVTVKAHHVYTTLAFGYLFVLLVFL